MIIVNGDRQTARQYAVRLIRERLDTCKAWRITQLGELDKMTLRERQEVDGYIHELISRIEARVGLAINGADTEVEGNGGKDTN